MKKLTYKELRALFRKHEGTKPEKHLVARIVFTEDSFQKVYSLESRTYEVSSNNKAFVPNMGGYSVFGSAMDGSDSLVRLDQYMAEEKGGRFGWKVDYCYMVEDNEGGTGGE